MVNRDFRINYNLNSEILHNLYYIIQNSAKKYLDYENLNGLLWAILENTLETQKLKKGNL